MAALLQQHNKGARARGAGTGVLVALLCVSVALITLYAREGERGPVHLVRAAVQTVAAPFAQAGSALVAPLYDLSAGLGDLAASDETLSELRARNAELSSQVAELNEYRLENERLRVLLGFSEAFGMSGLGASVIGTVADDWSSAIMVGQGSQAGVEAYLPVVDANGVVGQVTSVALTTSTVTLITDPTSQVSALLQGSRVTGLLEGSLDGSVHLNYVPVSTEVEVGELVVTSGLGGTYPRGLLLGSVSSVSASASDLYYDIVVEPVLDTSSLEEVYIVTSFDSAQAEASAENLLLTGSYTVEETLADEAADGEGAELAESSDAGEDAPMANGSVPGQDGWGEEAA